MSDATTIARVRLLTGATATDFDDTAVGSFLDANSVTTIRSVMTPGSYDSGYTYTVFQATPGTHWSETVELIDGTFAVIPAEDYTWSPLTGMATFAVGRTSSTAYVNGTVYDVNAACAELLDAWANRLALEFDVSLDGNSYNRSQKADALRNAAKNFRRKSRTRVGTTERADEVWK